jgi:hypothetical protein
LEISLSAAAIQPALKTSSLSRYAAPVELQIEGASSEEKTTPAATQRALAEALAQIESKNHVLSFQDSGKTIVKVAAVFSVKERNIVAWTHG